MCLGGSLQEIIDGSNESSAVMRSQYPPPDPSVQVRDEKINEHVTVRVYTPKEVHAEHKKLPVGVFTHGGGWNCWSIDDEDDLCRHFAMNLPCVVVSVDYRLGPKWKMPVMIDDCVFAFNWVCAVTLSDFVNLRIALGISPITLDNPNRFEQSQSCVKGFGVC